MKKIIIFLAFVALITSCDKMNDIHQKYIKGGEQVYLGKSDSIITYPGIGRAKLVWYTNADPKIESTVIFWNSRQDSTEHVFTRTQDGVQKDSAIIDGLPEGIHFFEFVNKNSRGERSISAKMVEATVYGAEYLASLSNRKIDKASLFLAADNRLEIAWGSALGTVVRVELLYRNLSDEETMLPVTNEVTNTRITDSKEAKMRYRTLILPATNCIDTFYLDYSTIEFEINSEVPKPWIDLRSLIPYDNTADYSSSYGFDKIWSGSYNEPYLSVGGGDKGCSLTFDLGKEFKIDRMALWHKVASSADPPEWIYWTCNILEFEMWGCKELDDSKLADHSYWLHPLSAKKFDETLPDHTFMDDWVYLGRYSVPRLDQTGAPSSEILAATLAGWQFDIPKECEPVRIIRFFPLATNSTPPSGEWWLGELSFWINEE